MFKESTELLEKLSEGYTVQSKAVNQFWLVLIISCIITLTGHLDNENLIELPFTLGKVNPSDFYSICLILISVISIIFTSAMIQTYRTRLLIQKIINKMGNEKILSHNIHIQDFLDSTLTPTYDRVAPIAQFLLGKNQFFGEGKQNKIIKRLAACFYVILKLSTFIFVYFIPYLTIYKCLIYLNSHSNSGSLNIPNWLLCIPVILSILCSLILFYADIKYLTRVFIRITK